MYNVYTIYFENILFFGQIFHNLFATHTELHAYICFGQKTTVIENRFYQMAEHWK